MAGLTVGGNHIRSAIAGTVFLVLTAFGADSRAGQSKLWEIEAKAKEQERREFPKSVVVDTLRVDGGGWKPAWLLSALREKNLSMVEIAPTALPGDRHRSRIGWTWDMPVALFKFVQFRLSRDGDPFCIADKELPTSIRPWIRRPPSLPDTCLSMKIVDKSTARHHLRYKAVHELGPPFGRWELFDQGTGRGIAALTTSDKPHEPRFNGDTSYSLVLGLADNSSALRRPPFQHYVRQLARLQHTSDASDSAAPEVWPAVRFSETTLAAADASSENQWNPDYEAARKTGWGYSQTDIVVQGTGHQWGAQTEGFKGAPQLLAGDQGFYVISGDWRDSERNWLSRYSFSGTFLWTIAVALPKEDATQPKCIGAYFAVRNSTDEVAFTERCRPRDEDETRATPNNAPLPLRHIVFSKKAISAALRRAAY